MSLSASPRFLFLTTFNVHWGATHSHLSDVNEFARTMLGMDNKLGVKDPLFHEAVDLILESEDIACFQEFPLRKQGKDFVPDIDLSSYEDTHEFFCRKTLNTSTYDQDNVPLRLRQTNQDIGVVTAVAKKLDPKLVGVIRPVRQRGDRSVYRSYPVVSVKDSSGTEILIVNVYGQSPCLQSRFNGARENLKDVLRQLKSFTGDKDLPIVIAGDLNLPLHQVRKLFERNGYHPHTTDIANVGVTFPTMTIPRRFKETLGYRRWVYNKGLVPGMQLDHIITLGDISIDFSMARLGSSLLSDHLPVSARIAPRGRVISPDFTSASGLERRFQSSFRPLPPSAS